MSDNVFSGHRSLIAILRGIKPEESLQIGLALVECGISIVEVPMNSPRPLESIRILAEGLAGRAMVGAGTVLNPDQIAPLREVGGQLVISPNLNSQLVEKTKALGLISCPGVFTATECFAAIDAGADILKMFPASHLGPSGIAALKAVLPEAIPIYAVGGVNAGNLAAYLEARCDGFGLGSNLYRPGASADCVARAATEIVAAYDAAISANAPAA